jgi:hypothetical protein
MRSSYTRSVFMHFYIIYLAALSVAEVCSIKGYVDL